MAVRRSRACLRVLWVVLVIAVLWPAPSMAIDLAETIRTCQGLSLAAKGWGSVEAPEPWGEGRPAHQPIQVPAATRAHVVADCQGAIAELFVEELRPDPSAVSITRTSTPGPEGGKLFTWHRYEWQYRASLDLGGGKTRTWAVFSIWRPTWRPSWLRASNPFRLALWLGARAPTAAGTAGTEDDETRDKGACWDPDDAPVSPGLGRGGRRRLLQQSLARLCRELVMGHWVIAVPSARLSRGECDNGQSSRP